MCSLSSPSPAHLAEEVHDLLAAARAALIATSALVCVFKFPMLLQLATALLRLTTHALWILCTLRLRTVRQCGRDLLATLAIIRMASVRTVRSLDRMRLLRVGELVVPDSGLIGIGELRLLSGR